MIEELQEILRHERKHFNFYLQASMELRGLARLYLKPLLEREMMGELEHVRRFGEKIVAMGGSPTTESHPFVKVTSAAEILREAIVMETEVLRKYHEVYSKAEKYAEEHQDMSIVLLLEENIEHTTEDLEEMIRTVEIFS